MDFSQHHSGPLEIHRSSVLAEWIDYNGHMNVGFYNLAFDHALDQVLDYLNLGAAYKEQTGNSTFVLETHVNYLREVMLEDPLRFTLQLLDVDAKRFHFFLRMYHEAEDFLSATSEQLIAHVDLSVRRMAPIPDHARTKLEALMASHATLERPAEVGRAIGIRRKPASAAS